MELEEEQDLAGWSRGKMPPDFTTQAYISAHSAREMAQKMCGGRKSRGDVKGAHGLEQQVPHFSLLGSRQG